MNKKFSKFIHEKINIKENKRLYLKSIFNKKLSVEELVDISNELNIPYANMLRLYLSGIKNYSYAYIVNIIDNNDLNSIKEMILNNGLIVGDNAIYINNEALSGQRIPLLFHHYQKILHILLSNNEVELAKKISSSKYYLTDFEKYTGNIESYLFEESSNCIAPFLNKIYTTLNPKIIDKIEPKIVEMYKNAILKSKKNQYIETNYIPLISIKNINGEYVYKMNELFNNFTLKYKLIIKEFIQLNSEKLKYKVI